MQFSWVTQRFAVAPQIEPADAPAIREAGFTDVICNRPDDEVPPSLAAEAVGAALEAEGVRLHLNPVRSGAMTASEVERQAAVLAEAQGPVLAYCRSGTRSTVAWAFGAREMEVDDILGAARQAGYDIAGLRPQLERR